MKRKNIDTMREIRLWVGQIIVPGVTLATTMLSIPEVRSAMASKVNEVKTSINRKNRKKNFKVIE